MLGYQREYSLGLKLYSSAAVLYRYFLACHVTYQKGLADSISKSSVDYRTLKACCKTPHSGPYAVGPFHYTRQGDPDVVVLSPLDLNTASIEYCEQMTVYSKYFW
jgi:hypothetical protein